MLTRPSFLIAVSLCPFIAPIIIIGCRLAWCGIWAGPRGGAPLIGWAAEGIPIFALSAIVGGQIREMASSYRLKSGIRFSGSSGRHDRTIVPGYAYVVGAEDSDECNKAVVTIVDYPDGTYAYFPTSAFPVIPLVFKGRADASFATWRG